MDNEKLEKLKHDVEVMGEKAGQLERAEKALSDWDKNVTSTSNVAVLIGHANNSTYMSRCHSVDENFINIVKAGLVAHIETLKSQFKKMKLTKENTDV